MCKYIYTSIHIYLFLCISSYLSPKFYGSFGPYSSLWGTLPKRGVLSQRLMKKELKASAQKLAKMARPQPVFHLNDFMALKGFFSGPYTILVV